ncbi:MAG: toll/interleukin-1 receptor domain-containing protein [Xenococcus sp. (in: cyanobacteria)]
MKDVFLSHANQDKDEYVLPFAEKLDEIGISFWLDEAEIRWGEKISARINEGLANSRFVIVFLTPAFIGRNWPENELSSALNRENEEGRTVVLPIVVGKPKILLNKYPLLRDKSYKQWDIGANVIADELKRLLEEDELYTVNKLQQLVGDRMGGKRKVFYNLMNFIDNTSSVFKDYAYLEMTIHEFSRLRAVEFYSQFQQFQKPHIENALVQRGLYILEALSLVAKNDLSQAANILNFAKSWNVSVEQQRHYLSLQEGIVLLALHKPKEANKAWQPLFGEVSFLDANIYPFSLITRIFFRSFLSLIFTDMSVEKIISDLPLKEYRGIGHLTAVTAQVSRRSKDVLNTIETWGKQREWKVQHSARELAGRIHSYEKAIFSKSGSLFRSPLKIDSDLESGNNE